MLLFVVININSKCAAKEVPLPVPFEKNEQWGYLDDKGTEIIKPLFLKAGNFKNGLTVIKTFIEKTSSFKYGVINTKGEIVVTPKYDYISDFCQDRAVIKENSKYGYMDTNGKIAIKPIYDEAYRFSKRDSQSKNKRSNIS